MPATGQRVLITGGTGSIGEELVRRFRKGGKSVWFTYKSNFVFANQLSSETGATPLQADFTTAPTGMIDIKSYGFDVLINNAAVNISRVSIHDVTTPD